MQQYIDAHCHILTDAEMQNAAAHGVGRFIVNATAPTDWAAVVELAVRENVYGAIGVHPWHVTELSNDWYVVLGDMLMSYPDLMVGEIGLDKNRPNIELQESVFRRGLQIAHDMHRVAHIHCVGAWGKTMDILRGGKLPPAMVFHAFSGAADLVPELVKMGAYFSFGAEICNEKHIRARRVVALVPESRLLVESDTASPAIIPDVVAQIAHMRGVVASAMAETIYNNTMGLLNGRQI